MKYLLVLPLFVLLLTGCSKSDREQIIGKWKFEELKSNEGEVMYSTDPAVQKKTADKIVKEQMVMYAGSGITEEMLRKQIQEQFKAVGKTTFEFDTKGNVNVKTNSGNNANDTKSTYKMDEAKKSVVIKNGDREMKYTYKFDGDKLTMKGEGESFTLKKA